MSRSWADVAKFGKSAGPSKANKLPNPRVEMVKSLPGAGIPSISRPSTRLASESYTPTQPSRLQQVVDQDKPSTPEPEDDDGDEPDSPWSYKSIGNLSSVTDCSDEDRRRPPIPWGKLWPTSPDSRPTYGMALGAINGHPNSLIYAYESTNPSGPVTRPPPGFSEAHRGTGGFTFDHQDLMTTEELVFHLEVAQARPRPQYRAMPRPGKEATPWPSKMEFDSSTIKGKGRASRTRIAGGATKAGEASSSTFDKAGMKNKATNAPVIASASTIKAGEASSSTVDKAGIENKSTEDAVIASASTADKADNENKSANATVIASASTATDGNDSSKKEDQDDKKEKRVRRARFLLRKKDDNKETDESTSAEMASTSVPEETKGSSVKNKLSRRARRKSRSEGKASSFGESDN